MDGGGGGGEVDEVVGEGGGEDAEEDAEEDVDEDAERVGVRGDVVAGLGGGSQEMRTALET